MTEPRLTQSNENGGSTRPLILVPLDGSELSETMLPYAVALARATSCELALLRVVQPLNTAGPIFGGMETLELSWQILEGDEAQAKKYLEGVVRRLQAEALVAKAKVLKGEPATTIVTYAEQDPHVQLIAMSTHGTSGLGRWAFGGVAEKVLRASPVPLLLVRPQEEKEGSQEPHTPAYRTILVPLDGSAFAEQALEQARALASTTGAALVLVTVLFPRGAYAENEVLTNEPWAIVEKEETERTTAYLADMTQQLRSAGLETQSRLEYGYPPEVILQVSEEMQADLLVMSTHGRGGLQRLWLGSVAMKVVQGTAAPVLLVRAKERESSE